MAERNYLPQFMVRGKIYSSNTRKPPGGDTNDIFGLEERQNERKLAIYTDKRRENTASPGDKFQKKFFESEDIPSPRGTSGRKLRRSLSEIRTKPNDATYKSPPLATGKENIGCYMKRSLSPASKIGSESKKLDKSEEENDDDETSTPENDVVRNPITGDILDYSIGRSKLEDSTNLAKEDTPESQKLKAPRRPCIRVRQPPGGKSSIVF